MPGVKRKASTASPFEAPAKLSKHSTSATIGGMAPPSLRRASTLTLQDPDTESAAKSALGRKSSTKGSVASKPSLVRKESSVSRPGLLTKLSSLKSGVIVGETSFEKGSSTGSLKKTLSKKKSSVGSPEESDVAVAVASLRSELSAAAESLGKKTSLTKSKTGSLSRTSSVKSTSSAHAGPSLAPPLPPGGLMEIAISFDTTGSMYSYLEEVRTKIQDLVQRLQADIPGIRISIIAHGDYIDKDKYVIKWVDFGSTLPELCNFTKNVESTYGGDGDECYELVLKTAREALNWTPGSQRALVVIGDAEPHEKGYRHGDVTVDYDWRDEVTALAAMNVHIYGVQAGSDVSADKFYNDIANRSGGKRLSLQQLSSLFDFVMCIAYNEANPDLLPAYEAEVRSRHVGGGMAKDLAGMFSKLKGGTTTTSSIRVFPTPMPMFPTPMPLFGGMAIGGAKKAKKPAAKKTVVTKKVKATKKTTKAGTKTPKGAAKKTTKAVKKRTAKPKTVGKTKKPRKAGKKKGKKSRKQIKKKTYRESVTEAKFQDSTMKNLHWSKWVLAIRSDKPKGKGSKSWGVSRTHAGYRLKRLFENDTRAMAIYEVAVHFGNKGKKYYVVYFRTSTGYTTKSSWESYILRNKSVRDEVEEVTRQGCNISIRRGVIPGTGATRMTNFYKYSEYLKKTYDYAWRQAGIGKKPHRKVTKNKIVISHNKF